MGTQDDGVIDGDPEASSRSSGRWRSLWAGGAQRIRSGVAAYPLIVLLAATALPFAGFASTNREQMVDLATVARLWVITYVASIVLYALVLLIARRTQPAQVAVGCSVFVLLFFHYDAWLSLFGTVGVTLEGEGWMRVLVWTVIAAIVVRLLAGFAHNATFRLWFVATLGIIVAVNLTTLAFAGTPGGQGRSDEQATDDLPADLTVEDPPNIYLFLLDAYARADVLEDDFGWDNSPFLAGLEDRGFVVADEAVTSFPVTFLSAMAMFENGYPAQSSADLAADLQGHERFIQGDNRAVRRLEALGYTFVHAPPGTYRFAACNGDFADECIAPDRRGVALGEVELTLLELTPVREVSAFTPPRTTPTYVLDQLEGLDPPEPFFLFAHVLSPHWPYYYDDQCSEREARLRRTLLSADEERAAYRNDIRCLNDEMTAVIDRILDDDPDAVIVVASDHGPEVRATWDKALPEWTEEALRERFAVLHALRLPPECRDEVGPATPLVHSTELVLACIEGRAPDLADLRVFMWRYDDQLTLDEMSDDQVEMLQRARPSAER